MRLIRERSAYFQCRYAVSALRYVMALRATPLFSAMHARHFDAARYLSPLPRRCFRHYAVMPLFCQCAADAAHSADAADIIFAPPCFI